GPQPAESSVATTHGATEIVAGCRVMSSASGFGTPTRNRVSHNTTKPSTKWVAEPALITTVRFQRGYRHIARGWSAGTTSSSCGVIPTIFTKPPSGIALSPYSVSPRRNDHRVGPNPAKYRVTFIPNALAVP